VSTEQIIYGESVRAIDRQEAALDGLRARTATLLSAAALATSVLGGQTLTRERPLDALAWLAVAAFVIVGSFCILVMLPWSWRFSLSAGALLDDQVEVPTLNTAAALHRFLAVTHETSLRRNRAKLDWLNWFFRLASASLALEVIAWTIDLGLR
jgi:hypothetical protein